MKIFKLNNTYSIICDVKGTRTGFKHEAKLTKNGTAIDFAKVIYCNRTWEAFQYQSVIRKLLDQTKELTDKEKRYLETK